MIYFYRFIWTLLLPIIDIWMFIRLLKGKEDRLRIGERVGFASKERPEGALIWFHCASVGESLCILPLVKQLLTENKNLNILVTTGTVTSAKLMKQRLPEGAFHQYIPIDFYFCVKSFMKHWKPDLSIFVESELWPELCRQAPNPIIINGRIGDTSAKRYKKLNWLAAPIFSRFNMALMQTDLDTERLLSFSDIPTETSGNLKMDAEEPPFDKEEFKQLQQELSGKKIFVAASTHASEEETIANLSLKISKDISNLITVIIPRHPNRGASIQAELEKKGITSTRRSIGENISNIYIADTLGEMGLWYNLATVIFMGKSLIPGGGQNPYEPLKCGKVTLCGPHMFNFKKMMHIFKEREIILQAENIEQLEKDLVYFLEDDKQRAVAEKHIKQNMQGLGGATKFTAQKLANILKGF